MGTVDLQDIHKTAFLIMHHIQPELVKGSDGRVVFRIVANSEVQALLMDYERNPEIRILDFVNVLKRLRGRMLDVRDSQNGYGERANGKKEV